MRLSARVKRGLAVEPVHVLVRGAVGLMREIVTQAVTSQPDMRLVPEAVPDSAQSPSEPMDATADVVVLVLHAADDANVAAAIEDQVPAPAIVAVDTLAQTMWLYDYELYRSNRIGGDLGPEAIVRAIRAASARLRRQ